MRGASLGPENTHRSEDCEMSHHTYCRICEALCGLVAEQDAEGGLRLKPDREHPISRGFVCAKGTRFAETASHPERLLHPALRRANGSLERVSWEQAMDAAGSKIRAILERHGPHAVGVYFGNPLAFNAFGQASLVQFLMALGSRNVYAAGSQDCNNKFAGSAIVHGSPVLHPIPDFERADLAVVLGSNPAVSQSSFVHLSGGSSVFDRMIERGADVLWVDPRRSESAERWGEHLALRPGSDVFLLLALLNSLRGHLRPQDPYAEGLEQLLALAARFPAERAAALCGIEAETIVALAKRLSTTRRVAFHMSVGVNQGPFGTLSYIALQALAYLTDNLDRPGGSLFHPIGMAIARLGALWNLDKPHHHSRVGHFPDTLRQLPGGILADEITTPGDEQIRALIVVAGDPLQSIPGADAFERALPQLESLVVIDMFENATARHADVLLPATSWLERFDFAATSLVLQEGGLLQTTAPVLDAPGETRHEARILADLSVAIGRPMLKSRALTRLATRVPWRRLLGLFLGRRGRYGLPVPAPKPGRYLGRGPVTEGHRLRFWDARLDGEVARLEAWAQRAVEQPFQLIGRRRRIGHNSWLHRGSRRMDEVRHAIWLHPEDLARLGNTKQVEVRSEAGSAVLPVEARDGVARGTVVAPHGLPQSNINALIPARAEHIERLSGNLLMTAVPVDLRAVEAR